MKTLEFLFDFGSPNAYFAWKVMPEIERRTGVQAEYTPVLLGGIFKLTGNQAPAIAFGNIKNKLPYDMLETRRFIAKHHLTEFNFNPHFPVNTLQIMRLAVAAQKAGYLPRYIAAVCHHMWEAPKKMDDPATIRAALLESGLDADALIAAAQTPEVKQALMDNTERAVERGAFGIPTFFVDGDIYFGKNTLRDVEEALAG